MLYKSRPPAVIIRPTAKSMPQLDFREALSTPEEKLFSPPAAVPVRSVVPAGKKKNIFGRGVRLNRSTWTNIVFVTIASAGGLVCAFYFFNGSEVLRAAAAWPSEFLYPRPLSTDKIDIGLQPTAVDQYARSASAPGESHPNSHSIAMLRIPPCPCRRQQRARPRPLPRTSQDPGLAHLFFLPSLH